jgi:TonB family protein
MYFDLEDYRPDTPHMSSAITVRESVLISLLAHAILVIVWLVMPEASAAEPNALIPQSQQESVKFVHMVPTVERTAPPKPNVDQSDLDRRATALERAKQPANSQPFSAGNTPEKTIATPPERAGGPETPPASSPPALGAADPTAKPSTETTPPTPPSQSTQSSQGLGKSLRNLTRYLQESNFDNQQGGQSDFGPDIQFDAKGVEFGPWLRRFIAQIKRNWYVPQNAMLMSGKVVIEFYVSRDGRLSELKIVSPSQFEAYNVSSFNALKNSNPTQPLPPEYPDDRAKFTVTFHYDVR